MFGPIAEYPIRDRLLCAAFLLETRQTSWESVDERDWPLFYCEHKVRDKSYCSRI